MALLDLDRLAELEAEGLTRAQGAAFAEAAAHCLEEHGHAQGVHLRVDGQVRATFELTWKRLPPNAAAAHRDLTDATEDGAVALAILVARVHLEYEVIQRSRKGSGFDYLLRTVDPGALAPYARLEVSGILKGTERTIASRVRRKVRQVRIGRSRYGDTPAFIAVIEFSTPLARIEEL